MSTALLEQVARRLLEVEKRLGSLARFRVSSVGPAEIIIAADTDNFDEAHNATLLLSQDGGGVLASLGLESDNAMWLRSTGAIHLGPQAGEKAASFVQGIMTLFGNLVDNGGYISMNDSAGNQAGQVGFIGTADELYILNRTANGDIYISVDQNSTASTGGQILMRSAQTTVATFDKINSGGRVIISGPNWNFGPEPLAFFERCGLVVRSTSTAAGEGVSTGIAIQTRTGTDRIVVMRVYATLGNELGFVLSDNSDYADVRAANYNVPSTVELKSRVRRARDEGGVLDLTIPGDRETAFDRHLGMEVVLFDRKGPHYDLKWSCSTHADRDECDASKGRPGEECDGGLRQVTHVCSDDSECSGSDDGVCRFVEARIDQASIVTEELAKTHPKCVSYDETGKPTGNRLYGLVMENINTIGHLIEDRNEMRRRAEVAEERVDALEERLARLEAHLGAAGPG